MNLEELSKLGKGVKFIFNELEEAYENRDEREIIKLQDAASTCLFWYYLEMGAVIVDYKEEENQMLEEEKERTDINNILEQLKNQFNEMGYNLRRLAKIHEYGLTNIPED